ncbi:hypoxanthine phosphoribosyltransferase [Candidatus Saccharibacteria bacterium]|nr:hypoxanthine phosphoribosyltransferase [Candidatus Saccharibacteria bacterium]NIV04142.1 hypoxanthine phosphoribosyltransferase [Calditrichia bacterium]NIV72562.1 hypoxanthine phosphoribosyltransferase [Calditrichia bacterium]NIV99679.1 hypoxanthine phosphoribosyltransferase [Candidatus Saccharibacteria bacterium]NIW79986.1 hypoxanthine phosphoribosyltransferase [Calditrichia bacterium]
MKGPDLLQVNNQKFRVLISEEEIQERIKELAHEISREYEGKVPIMVGVLNGAVLFLADLIRNLTIDCEIDFIKISSYGNARVSSGEITMIKDFSADLQDRDIIVVEDVVDSGLSVQYLKRRIKNMKPASLKLVSLLAKQGTSKVNLDIDYLGFEIENKFVIGYGLDYKQLKRNVNAIYQLVE